MAEFIIQRQQESEWCWAAVGASISQYFNPRSPLNQCQVASRVLGKDVCLNPSQYNQPEDLELAVQKVGRLKIGVDRALTFSELRAEIDAGRPVCAGIKWASGGGHAVVLTGYRVLASGVRQVHVEDPLNPSGDVDFDEFSTSYYGDGTWQVSELLAAASGGQS